MFGTATDFVTAGALDLGHAIDQAADAAGRSVGIGNGVAHGAEIGVAAGRRQRGTAIEQARASDQVLVDGRGQAPIGPAGVAHCCEATHQHAVEDLGGLGSAIVGRPAFDQSDVGRAGNDVHMGIAKAWHQGAPSGVDDPRFAGRNGFVGNLLDAALFDQHVALADQFAGFGVEQLGVGDDGMGHG